LPPKRSSTTAIPPTTPPTSESTRRTFKEARHIRCRHVTFRRTPLRCAGVAAGGGLFVDEGRTRGVLQFVDHCWSIEHRRGRLHSHYDHESGRDNDCGHGGSDRRADRHRSTAFDDTGPDDDRCDASPIETVHAYPFCHYRGHGDGSGRLSQAGSGS
jgi:hypothetical protein